VPKAERAAGSIAATATPMKPRSVQAHDDRPLLEQMTRDERERFVRAVAGWLLSSVMDDTDRLREPAYCPRCRAQGPFDYDVETHSWICPKCAATWPAGVEKVRAETT